MKTAWDRETKKLPSEMTKFLSDTIGAAFAWCVQELKDQANELHSDSPKLDKILNLLKELEKSQIAFYKVKYEEEFTYPKKCISDIKFVLRECARESKKNRYWRSDETRYARAKILFREYVKANA